MIESMACGTPVIATRHGAVPEVIEHGRSGVIVDDWAKAGAALEEADAISPESCRAYAEQWFAPARMVRDYLAAYETMLAGRGIIRGAVRVGRRSEDVRGGRARGRRRGRRRRVRVRRAGRSRACAVPEPGAGRRAGRLPGRSVADDPSKFSAIVAKAAFTHDYDTVWTYLNPSLQTAVSQKKWQACQKRYPLSSPGVKIKSVKVADSRPVPISLSLFGKVEAADGHPPGAVHVAGVEQRAGRARVRLLAELEGQVDGRVAARDVRRSTSPASATRRDARPATSSAALALVPVAAQAVPRLPVRRDAGRTGSASSPASARPAATNSSSVIPSRTRAAQRSSSLAEAARGGRRRRSRRRSGSARAAPARGARSPRSCACQASRSMSGGGETGTIVARRLDPDAARVAGEQRPVAEVADVVRGVARAPGRPPSRATSPSAIRMFASGTGASSPQSVSNASP